MRSFLHTFFRAIAPLALVLLLQVLPLVVAAQQGTFTPGASQGTFTPSNPQGTFTSADPQTLQNPLGVNSFCELIGVILQAAIAIGIPIAVLFIVWAGFKFILARGSPGELSEARSNLIATLIGIAIFLGASLIANVIIGTLRELGVQGISSC